MKEKIIIFARVRVYIDTEFGTETILIYLILIT